MKIRCKDCGNEIDYKFSLIKNSSRIRCYNCLTTFRFDKIINYNKKIYNFVIGPLGMWPPLAVLIFWGNGEWWNFSQLIKLIIGAEYANLVQYIFIVYSIKKYGLKE